MSSDEDVDMKDLHEISQEVGERVKEITSKVHPFRVALAGIITLLILGSMIATWHWIIPRDSVEVETIYVQRTGHIVMNELSNSGSRAITDVSFEVEFVNSDKEIIGDYSAQFNSIPSHTSISGNSMELVVRGYTVWENYTVVITVEWVDFQGNSNAETFIHEVGPYAYEKFSDECESTTWFL